ncbi:diaminopimelate epimerase [soil metagenome]
MSESLESDRTFVKYEGLGNDFLVVDAGDVSAAEAMRLCDRHFGVGGDGVLMVTAEVGARARMTVRNADGSSPEMCGNGLRCVALHLALVDGQADVTYAIATDAGVKTAHVTRRGESDSADVRVDMGIVRALGKRLVKTTAGDFEIEIGDAGNPHAILFGEYTRADVDRLGPILATHPDFPRGTNVEFCNLRHGEIETVVWERGVGITLACGTGACAVAVVAKTRGLVAADQSVTVALPGGRLVIEPGTETTSTWMTGPARRVFAGEVLR